MELLASTSICATVLLINSDETSSSTCILRFSVPLSTQTSGTALDYGAELGVRIFDLLYIGTRAGVWKYQLFKSKEDGEITGKWMGLGGSASVGMIMPISKRASWQTSLDLGQATMRKVNNTGSDASTGNKKLSRISITVGFVYNDDDTESGSVKLLRSYF